MSGLVRVLLVGLYAALPFLTACSPELQEPVKHFELQAPKPYGYVIGDEIHHRIVIETRSQLVLADDSVPTVGALNRWLQLKAINRSVHALDESNLTVLDLTYQIFYAPLEVKMLKIPGFTLRFTQHEQTLEQTVPEWYFTMSPLHELAIRKENGHVYLRPDAPPDYLDEQPVTLHLLISMSAVVLSGCYLAYLYGLLPGFRNRSIFKQASRQLAKLSVNEIGTALRIVHQALNARNRKPLFKHQLDNFYRQQPEFNTLAEELDWFFTFSSQYFFGNRRYVEDAALLRLQQLCRRCRRIERENP